MIILAKFRGGSYLYGLATPESDIDERGVFLNTEISKILGIEHTQNKHLVKQNSEVDVDYSELREFLTKIKGGATPALEALWAPDDAFEVTTPLFDVVRRNRERLTDVRKVAGGFDGYLRNQIQAVFNASGKAEEGKARAEMISKYGYANKPAYHVMRLSESAINLLTTGVFTVKPKRHMNICWNLKCNPLTFKPEEVKTMMENAYEKFDEAFKESQFMDRKFDDELANNILLSAYTPFINKARYQVAMKEDLCGML